MLKKFLITYLLLLSTTCTYTARTIQVIPKEAHNYYKLLIDNKDNLICIIRQADGTRLQL